MEGADPMFAFRTCLYCGTLDFTWPKKNSVEIWLDFCQLSRMPTIVWNFHPISKKPHQLLANLWIKRFENFISVNCKLFGLVVLCKTYLKNMISMRIWWDGHVLLKELSNFTKGFSSSPSLRLPCSGNKTQGGKWWSSIKIFQITDKLSCMASDSFHIWNLESALPTFWKKFKTFYLNLFKKL